MIRLLYYLGCYLCLQQFLFACRLSCANLKQLNVMKLIFVTYSVTGGFFFRCKL